jgi:hypothetical protein
MKDIVTAADIARERERSDARLAAKKNAVKKKVVKKKVAKKNITMPIEKKPMPKTVKKKAVKKKSNMFTRRASRINEAVEKQTK